MAKGLADIPQPRGDIIVRGFEQPAPDNGVLHTKMVIADGQRATVLGSPLLPAVLRRPAAPDRQPGARRHHVRHRPRRQHRPGRTGGRRPARDVPARTGTRTRRRATRSRRCSPSRSPRPSPAGPTASSRSRSSAPSAPAGSASCTGTARRASSRATCGPSARRKVHLPGEPVLHRRDHHRRAGPGPQGQAGAGADLPAQHQAGRDLLPRTAGHAWSTSSAPPAPDRVGIFTRWSYNHAHPAPRGSRRSTCTPRRRSSTTPGRPSARPTSTGSPSTTTSCSARSPSARRRPPS